MSQPIYIGYGLLPEWLRLWLTTRDIFPRLRWKWFTIARWRLDDQATNRLWNCHAHALEEQSAWIAPEPHRDHEWPEGVERSDKVGAFVALFKTHGYKLTSATNTKRQDGYDKVAFYSHRDGHITHTAKQRPDGKWESKLGEGWVVIHPEADDLAPWYGEVCCVMRRKR